MLDDMLSYVEHIRERPVWKPIPADSRSAFEESLPKTPTALADVYQTFQQHILPHAIGNTHPGFMGWVHGGGNLAGALGEMLAAFLNANLGGRDHIPIQVERQILAWSVQMFGFPATASGLFVTGTSMANFIGVTLAIRKRLGLTLRQTGITSAGKSLIAYTSASAHQCIAQAFELSGLGSNALRLLPLNDRWQLDLHALNHAIDQDRRNGFEPFLIIGTAGSVDVGAIDDLDALADIAAREQMTFHVDGAFGALAILSSAIAPKLKGIERADSIGYDFHKWAQVPYDAGFILVRDGQAHLDAFSSPVNYLARETRGMAAGSPWPCDYGPDLSRGFKALKTWFTFQVYGSDRLGQMVQATCQLAQYLAACIEQTDDLELLAPVALNIVCFRYRCANPDQVNADIVIALQESGLVAPSSTRIHGQFAIRAAIVNHRTEPRDIDMLISATLRYGNALRCDCPEHC
jgi:glutamate/tyrosine decarboxylase-like PLP-dependent enzyme